MPDSSVERSPRLVLAGWITLSVLYVTQVVLLVLFLATNENGWYGWYSVMFLFAPLLTIAFFCRNWEMKYADDDEEIRLVWTIWCAYIVPFVVAVATIFATVAKNLTTEDGLGVNSLKMTLCFTPGMLILFLQLAISPTYRKPVLALSLFAALNMFDGIEMLETFLMQNEKPLELESATEGVIEFWKQQGGYFNFSHANATKILEDFLMKKDEYFDLNTGTEVCIVVFACVCFLLSSFGLARNKFESDDNVKERTVTSIVFGFLEIFGTNLPFLAMRSYIWRKHKYEAAVFIAKNIVSLVAGAVEFGILIKMARDK